ncbi:MAG: class I SAM-dependent DNA methyltransferase [Bacteroidaceae bacterium]|nr:class I SAM-dependent DNA methyltransferase [Bacteroidaceae bacterium]
MATNQLSYIEIEQRLRAFADGGVPASEVGYTLLYSFGKSEADIRRYKAGKGVVAKFEGLLVKGLLAYKACPTHLMDETLNAMKHDAALAKAAPRILAVSDGGRILAYDPKGQETYENPLGKLWIDFQFFYPLCGVERYRGIEENPADVKAAEKMAKLHDEIRAYNDFSSHDDLHDLNIFMTRLLFCYFAEDTGIFDDNLFTSSIDRYTKDDGSDLSSYLDEAFNVMDRSLRIGVPGIFTQFPYVNGGLFSKRIRIPQMGGRARRLIIECGQLNWKDINPDIFGSMIQAVVSPSQRGTLGMHYTSVPNIMKVIQPLFLDDLYEEFANAKANVKKLRQLLIRISRMKFFDPACGSGNFLIIAYKELRKLEIQIWKQIGELSGSYELPFVNIQLTQFYGIEIDDFAAEVASLSLRLAEHQMNCQFTREFANVSIPALPLGKSGNIVHGNACRVDWNEVCPHTKEEEVFVMGNPPYLGSRRQDDEQKEDMRRLFVKDYGELDYISCWFLSAAQYIRNTNSKSAFVSTNSICQGLQVCLLWKRIIYDGLVISFAHKSFKWSNNAKYNAGVTVIVVGLAMNDNIRNKIIYDGNQSRKVKNISPLLMDGPTIFVKSETTPLCDGIPTMNFGNMPADGGKLIMSTEEREELISQYPDAKKYIKPLIGAEDFINGKRRWCIWLYSENPQKYLLIPEFRQRIEELKVIREKSSRPQLAAIPHLFAQITQPLGIPFIIIPAVSSEHRNYIPMGYLDENNIAANSCMVVGTNEKWLFGILTSLMHMAWVKTVGGRLETRYRYSAQLCYNTFPFPKISEAKKKEIEEAAEEVLLVREDYPGKTLADLYDPDKMPDDLREAHHQLDLIVESCYQDTPFANDEERLECLFKLYEKMTKK